MKRKLKKIALINPKKSLQTENPEIYAMFEKNKDRLKPWMAPPLNLMTIAAVTPEDIDIKIIDEHYEKVRFTHEYDLVGLTAMTQQANRAYEIASGFRKLDVPVVMGGIHATVLPDEALKHVDTIFLGESEDLWPAYLNDFKIGKEKNIYKNETIYDLTKSPVPKYDLIKHEKYQDVDEYFNYIPVQATRGCPHDCAFCVVSKFYGKKIRKKNPEQIVKEIEYLNSFNSDSLILFADDNLFVDRKYAKSLLKALVPLNIKYFAQSDVKVAQDPELLELAYQSGCQIIFIGFESLNPNNLRDINQSKFKMKQIESYKECIAKIQENGIVAFGAFVIGLPNDDLSIFEAIREFTVQNKIPGQFTLVTPIPGSNLYKKLHTENKLYEETFWNKCSFYNLVFEHDKLTKEEAESKLIWLYEEVFNKKNSLERLIHMKNIYKKLPKRWNLNKLSVMQNKQ